MRRKKTALSQTVKGDKQPHQLFEAQANNAF
jgi:hypothetical protein